jgi:hypothetical protein
MVRGRDAGVTWFRSQGVQRFEPSSLSVPSSDEMREMR